MRLNIDAKEYIRGAEMRAVKWNGREIRNGEFFHVRQAITSLPVYFLSGFLLTFPLGSFPDSGGVGRVRGGDG